MSRSLRQLWAVRERYIKEERGWGENDISGAAGCHHDGEDEDSLLEESSSDDDELDRPCVEKRESSEGRAISHLKESENVVVQDRLNAVDDYYVSPLLPGFYLTLMKPQSEKSYQTSSPW